MANIIKSPGPESLFFSPSQAATYYVEWAKRSSHTENDLDFGVPSLDKYILPLKNGWIRAIVARPGHGKTALAVYLARREAERLAQIPNNNKVVVYWTMDQQVEEIEAILQSGEGLSVNEIAWGKVDTAKIEQRVVGRESLPLWYIGSSEIDKRKHPDMTYRNVLEAIASMRERHSVEPDMLVIDFLQKVPTAHHTDRWTQVREAALDGNDLTLSLNLKTIYCVQANRSVEKESDKIPGLSNADGSAAVEWVAHQQHGIWRPALTEKATKVCPIRAQHILKPGVCPVCGGTGQVAVLKDVIVGGHKTDLNVTQNLFVLRNNKQRFSAAGQTFMLYADMGLVALTDMELAEEDYG